jgi:hypothetical protein
MSRQQTADEVLEEFRKTYPRSIADLAHQLWNDICFLNLSVSAYLQLYSSQQTVEILNSSAPRFFACLQNWLRLTISLEIGRLTDAVQSGTRSNASFAGFAKLLREAGETAAADMLEEDLKALKKALQKILTIRHRTQAHADLKPILREDSPVPEVPRNELETLVDAIGNTYSRIDARFRRTQSHFRGMDMFTGVDVLTTLLERGALSLNKRNSELCGELENEVRLSNA